MTEQDWISHNDARELIGRAIYRDDWIESLTAEEVEILNKYGPRRRPRPSGASGYFEIIAPCPKGFRNKLNAAIGRDRRMIVQLTTVLEWLEENSFGAVKDKYSRKSIESAAVSIVRAPTKQDRPPSAGKRGPVKGSIARYAEHDRSMFPQMRWLIEQHGMSATGAALKLADQLKGDNTSRESKATRLRKLFQTENY